MTRRLNSIERRITVTYLRRNFNTVVRRLRQKHEHALIQSGGVPVAVILSISEYEQLVAYRRRESLAAFHNFARSFGKEVERRGLTEEQLMADLEITKREIFNERSGMIL